MWCFDFDLIFQVLRNLPLTDEVVNELAVIFNKPRLASEIANGLDTARSRQSAFVFVMMFLFE